jgi:hypothetical protein
MNNAHPYRTQPALYPTDYRVLIYALVAALVAALGFAAVALSLALARIPSEPPPPLPNVLTARATEAPTCPTVVAPAVVAPAVVASPVVAPSLVKVRVSSEPDDATVMEDGVPLCSSTPCEILYKGADAEPGREHVLTFVRSGFRPETRVIKPADAPLAVKLTRD